MKRTAHSAQSSLIDTTNYQSPKRSCTPRTKRSLISQSAAAACSSDDGFSMDEHLQSLLSMGFLDQDLNRRLLIQTQNDIGEVVTLLTSYSYSHYQENDYDHERNSSSMFNSPLKQEQSQATNNSTDGQQTNPNESTENIETFTSEAFFALEKVVYGDNWSIPYRQDEPLGICLLSATKLASAGKADHDKNCFKFMEELIPEAFYKLQCSNYVNNWVVDVQNGVFDMSALLIDLIAARLNYPPVPVRLLETLAILFNCDSVFQKKHRAKPYDRSLYHKQLADRVFASPPSTSSFSIYGHSDTYGWLCELINRFVLKDGILCLKRQFQSDRPLTSREYNALLIPFVNCMDYISLEKYRQWFGEHIDQVIEHIQKLKDEDFKAKSSNYIFELLSTIRKISSIVWPNRLEAIDQLYLNTLLNMIGSSNFNAKMNSLKELAKLIENSNANNAKVSIRRDVISHWIIDNSVLSKALEGNIDQNQYVDQVRILMDFIAAKISKEDIKTIWNMQHGRSSVAVDHLFTLIASAAVKFNLEQLNHLIEFIYESWKTETILIQEKLVELLGTIGRDGSKEAGARVLEVLWTMAHEERLNRSMLDHLLHWHLRIFSESRSSYWTLKREYCLKCVADLQRKQGWLIPAIRHLYDLLHHDSGNTFKRNDHDIVPVLVNKNDIIQVLIQSLSTCQRDVWTKTKGKVTIDTLVDGRYTHEESVKTHLDLLSFLLKKGNLFLSLKCAEELWDTLISNEHASSFDHELGLNWFITCVQDLNQEAQIALFKKRVSKLDPLRMTAKGYDCFRLYFQRCNFEGRSPPRTVNYLLNNTTSTNHVILDHEGLDELWNIILCVSEDNLADLATRFLLDVYYSRQPLTTRRTSTHILHQNFLQAVYTRLSFLLRHAVPPSPTESVDYYKSVKLCGEQLMHGDDLSPSDSIDHRLWSQKIERLLMMTEEYINLIEPEHSATSHINSFHGLEYQIKVVLGDNARTTTHHDIAIVHSNDTLDMLRQRLGQFYKVSTNDIHISIQTTRPLPLCYQQTDPGTSSSSSSSSANNTTLGVGLNSKYLYEIQITPGTTIYLKIVGAAYNQVLKSIGPEPKTIPWTSSSRYIATRSYRASASSSSATPSTMIGDNSKMYDVLYTLSFLNKENIQRRIRNLLYLLPSDSRIYDRFDQISLQSGGGGPSTRNLDTSISPIKAQRTLEQMFDLKRYNCLQLLYTIEILSSKILPLSTNNGMRQSSKLFRQDFLEQSGVEHLFRLLHSLPQCMNDDYQYALCEEIILQILQLLRLFLCGGTQSIESNSLSPVSSVASSISPINERKTDWMQWDLPGLVEKLSQQQYIERVKQLIFLSWAAAAGNLRLREQKVTMKEQVKLDRHALLQQINKNVFSRQNSKSSVSDESAMDSSVQKPVQFGICVKNTKFLPLDGEIAAKLIEMITFCFETRSEFLSTFLSEAFFADYLLEILIGTTSREVRRCAVKNLIRLCNINPAICDLRSVIHQILIKARLPLWCNSSATLRGSSQKLVSQSSEYFEVRCYLTEGLTHDQQKILGIDSMELLTEEFTWLSTYTFSSNSKELQMIDNVLLLGHLKFIRTLLTCENVDKNQFGRECILLLLDQYLFPASKKISLTMHSSSKQMITYEESLEQSAPEPKCSTDETRSAAYDALVELVRYSYSNLKVVAEELILLHHSSSIEKQTEWEFLPQVSPRAPCGFVGLYNGGATCYMNSILQQMYMIPQISEYILSLNDDGETKGESKSNGNAALFYQLQQVFGHLFESKMQYYVPEALWKVFRLWGQEINVREQQDAFDFFTSLVDQVDEYLKSIKQEEIFRKQFEGVFCNQMICTNGCRHRYEGEERFMALNVAVKVDSLSESLNQFVKGEVLDGNNAYFCEKCEEKRTTIKRLCIKKLPPLLCIQMKRFGFDWENNRALKFDDYFRFPFILNMEPYTLEGVTKRETFNQVDDLTTMATTSSTAGESRPLSRSYSASYSTPPNATINYELIGIVIHSGQANAGHYYSFIKDIRDEPSSNRNQWYRFNDTSVDEIQLTEQMLEEECFGGTFRAANDKNNSGEERIRFWNAYLLIYRCMEPNKLFPAPAVPPSPNNVPQTARQRRRQRMNDADSLTQLADLVVQSEQNKLFQTKHPILPSRVRSCVKDENLEFLRNRDTYCEDYFRFIYKLSTSCLHQSLNDPNATNSYQICTKLALQYLFCTYLRTHRRLRKDFLQSWIDLLSELFARNVASCTMFYRYLLNDNEKLLKCYLLECPIDDIRQICRQFCEKAFEASFEFHLEDKENSTMMKKFLEQCLNLLEKTVVEQVKQSHAYFQLIQSVIQMNKRSIEYLFRLNAYGRLMNFLLGENLPTQRWTTAQAKDFVILHEILSLLTVHAFASQDTMEKKATEKVNTIKEFLCSDAANRYLREICYVFQDVPSNQLTQTSQALEEFIKDNPSMSERIVRILIQMIEQANPNELKPLFQLFQQILCIPDSLQIKRLQLAFEGVPSSSKNEENNASVKGLYHLIKTSIEADQRRAYQTVKFLTTLAKKTKSCKEYFYSTATEWEAAINWLKQQMQTSVHWSPAQNLSNDDNDTRLFQRTRSAQFTLEEAQHLLRQSPTSVNGTIYHDNPSMETNDSNDSPSHSSSQSTLVMDDSSNSTAV